MGAWVVAFDCGEAWMVEGKTREEAAMIHDDLGCAPVAVYGPKDITIRDMWTKNGYLRVSFDLRPDLKETRL